MNRLIVAAICCLSTYILPTVAYAISAQWDLAPISGDWNTATNWTPDGVPNGPADIAMFGLSHRPNVSFSANTEVNSIIFTAAAGTVPYIIAANAGLTLTISGVGITNNSGRTQNFLTLVNGVANFGEIIFTNSAAAGSRTTFSNNGGTVIDLHGGLTQFDDTSSAGSATINNNGAVVWRAHGGFTQFNNTSSAGSATINNNGGTAFAPLAFGSDEGGFTEFNDTSSAGSATISNYGGAVLGVSGGFTEFNNSSTAASATITNYGPTVISAGGGFTEFNNNSTAGSATITNNGAAVLSGEPGGLTGFHDNSTAGNATITNNGATVLLGDRGGFTFFSDNSTAANATFINNGALVSGEGGGYTQFADSSTAANGTFTNNGGTVSGAHGGFTRFFSSTAANATFTNNGGTASGAEGGFTTLGGTAANGTFTNNGGTASGAHGGVTSIFGGSTAANATFINNGGTVSGAEGGVTRFFGDSTAANATLIANGGVGGGQGGTILFEDQSTGGTSQIEVFGNGNLDISFMNFPHNGELGVTVGSVEGDGNIFLGEKNLTVGSNDFSTVFSGEIQDGGQNGGTGGSLTKVGLGTLVLSGVNTYTGDTKVNNGLLQVNGSITSNVFVNHFGHDNGTLAGTGIINANVMNRGTVRPGGALSELSALTVVHNYTQVQYATLMIQIAGANSGDFSVLNVLGNASLNGFLDPVLLNGFVPTVGDSFVFLNYASFIGEFSHIKHRVFDNGLLQWSVVYEDNHAVLTVEQHVADQGSTFLLLTLGLLGLVAYRKTTTMKPLIQQKKATSLFLVALVYLALSPSARAVDPPPDGGYPGQNTAKGTDALLNLTTGSNNTAIGFSALLRDTTGSGNTAVGTFALKANIIGGNNTAAGRGALYSNMGGSSNIATGYHALYLNLGGSNNVPTGVDALYSNKGGDENAATGFQALYSNLYGNENTATGAYALYANTSGLENTAFGYGALLNNTTGDGNIALGPEAGLNVSTASGVICIGSQGANVGDSCFIGRIRGVTTVNNDAIPVLIDSAGQLGTASSSRRYKIDIKPIDTSSESIFALKPVSFRYKMHKDSTPQFGLIAEEVAAVNPDLVVHDEKGEIYPVRYDAVNAMLLNEFLKEHRKNEEQEATIACLQKQMEALTAAFQKVSAQLEMNQPRPQTVLNNR